MLHHAVCPENTPPDQAEPQPPPGSQPSTDPQPLKNESDRAFEAFRAYWELGPQRRFAAAARKVGVSLRTVRRWAGEFDWRGRIKTWAWNTTSSGLRKPLS